MIVSTVKVLSRHWMGKHMKGCIKRVKSAFKVAKRVSTDLSMKESSRMICSTDRESSFMQTDSQAMKANGWMAKCTAKACTSGVTVVATKVSTNLIRKMALESICGLMAARITVCGKMEIKMEKVPKSWQIWTWPRASGSTERNNMNLNWLKLKDWRSNSMCRECIKTELNQFLAVDQVFSAPATLTSRGQDRIQLASLCRQLEVQSSDLLLSEAIGRWTILQSDFSSTQVNKFLISLCSECDAKILMSCNSQTS